MAEALREGCRLFLVLRDAPARRLDEIDGPAGHGKTLLGLRRQVPLPIQQRMALTGCPVCRRIISQMRDIAPHTGNQNLPPKNAGNADSAVLFCLSRQKLG
jgi:hypothetical protein